MKLLVRKIVIFLLLLNPGALKASSKVWDFSLFFKAHSLESKLENSLSRSYHESGIVGLGAIFYRDKNSYVLWINGKAYQKEDLTQDLKVEMIKNEYVIFSWYYQGTHHKFHLYPNQTYKAAIQEVREGLLLR